MKAVRTPEENRRISWFCFFATLAFLGLVLLLDQLIKPTSPMYMLLTVLQKGSVYALAAVSMNLLNGCTGLFSLGHAGFMLIGAYTYAIFTIPSASRDTVYQYYDAAVRFSFPEVFGNAMGPLPVLRLTSDYLATATLGFAEILRAVCQWQKLGPITNGSNLLKSFARVSKFKLVLGSTKLTLSTFVPVLIAAVSIMIIVKLINSTYGRAFKAIRDDEVAAEAMGINLAKHKMISFTVSSFFAGVAGAMMAMVLSIAQASNFKSAMTYEILLMVVLGGIGSTSGSVIGSFLFVAASEWWLRGLDSGTFLGINAPNIFRNGFRLVVFSVIIMIVVLFFRQGIMGERELTDVWLNRRRARQKKKEAGK